MKKGEGDEQMISLDTLLIKIMMIIIFIFCITIVLFRV